MATYKKPLKGFMGETLGGYSFTAIDTADGNRIGSYAVEAFKAKKTIKAENDGKEVLIPFHAVKLVQYGTQTANATKGNPYGCESGGGDKGELVFTATIDTSAPCELGRTVDELTPVGTFDYEDVYAHPDSYGFYINDTELPIVSSGGGTVYWSDADMTSPSVTAAFGIHESGGHLVATAGVLCDVEVVNVYMTKK